MIKKQIELIKHSSFGKDAIIYMIATIFSAGLSFILLTVLTKFLSPRDFGIIENFVALTALLTSLILWGGNTVVINYYSQDKKNQFNVVVNGIIVQSVLFLIVSFFYTFIFFGINRIILIIAIVFSILNSLFTLITTSLQLEKKAIKYAIIVLSFSVLNTILSILLVLNTKDYFGRIISFIIAVFDVLLVIGYPFIRSKLKDFSFKIAFIKEYYTIGYLLAAGQVISWCLEKIDRFMITGMLSIEDAGIYSVGYLFGTIVLVLQSAISRAWLPYIIDKVKENNKKAISRAIKYLTLFMFIFSVIVSLVSYLYIIFIIDKKFHSAAYISIIVCFGYFFDGIWKLYNGILVYENMFKFYTIAVFFAGFINILLNYITIPIWGINGAALATVFSFFGGYFVSIIYVRHNLAWFKK